MTAEEAARLARNVARNVGWPVFPCREDKRPATPHGFKNAATDPEAIAALWRRYPGPLIGVATGERSGIDVLDIDVKHAAALAWWKQREPFLPQTMTYRTRSGGLHLYLRHRQGVKSKAGTVVEGIDTRGEGGYVIFWFAAGLEQLDATPPAAWPGWLFLELFPPPKPPAPTRGLRAAPAADARLAALLRTVTSAAEGQRNATLFWASCRAAEMVRAGQLGRSEAAEVLHGAALAAGFAMPKSARTIASGLAS